MKINKLLVVLLFIGLILEILIKNVFFNIMFEFQIILDIVFVFYIANKDLFLKEQSYKDQNYLLNMNNLIILIFMYIESIYSSNLYFVNVIFIFLTPYVVVNDYFPSKMKINFFSILIIYMSSFFIIKDYFLTVYFTNYNVYVNLILLYKIFVDILINILIIIIIRLLFYKKLKVVKKSRQNKV